MKKIIAFVTMALLIAAPCMADTWTINFTLSTPADHIDLKYAAYSEDFTAAQFMNRSDLQTVTIPAKSPQTFEIDFPKGTRYAVFGEILNANGDKDYFMDSTQGYLSPTVWRTTALDVVGEAHYQDISPAPVSGGVVNIITINNSTGN